MVMHFVPMFSLILYLLFTTFLFELSNFHIGQYKSSNTPVILLGSMISSQSLYGSLIPCGYENISRASGILLRFA